MSDTAPEGFIAHPVVDRGTINALDLVQGPTVIDYLSARDRLSYEAACDVLKQKLAAGRLRAEGPNGPVDPSWWRYAMISPDGRAVSLRPPGAIAWFLIAAMDVLDLWPSPPEWMVSPGQPKSTKTRPSDQDVYERVSTLFESDPKRRPKIRETVIPALQRETSATVKQIRAAINQVRERTSSKT